MSKPNYESLSEFDAEISNHWGGWDAYRYRFFRSSPEARNIELSAFDQLLENETRPTRETAEWLTRRRELGDWHNTLKRAGR